MLFNRLKEYNLFRLREIIVGENNVYKFLYDILFVDRSL